MSLDITSVRRSARLKWVLLLLRNHLFYVSGAFITMKYTYIILVVILIYAAVVRSCPCPDVYQPVCSTTGVTYANVCQLKCAKEVLYQMQACDKDLAA